MKRYMFKVIIFAAPGFQILEYQLVSTCNRSWKFGTEGQPPVFLSDPATNEAV